MFKYESECGQRVLLKLPAVPNKPRAQTGAHMTVRVNSPLNIHDVLFPHTHTRTHIFIKTGSVCMCVCVCRACVLLIKWYFHLVASVVSASMENANNTQIKHREEGGIRRNNGASIQTYGSRSACGCKGDALLRWKCILFITIRVCEGAHRRRMII